MNPLVKRRDVVAGVFGAAVLHLTSACKHEMRCKHCGMKVDPLSPWRAEVVGPGSVITTFDTPRCALTVWRSGRHPEYAVRVIDYYDRQLRDGTELRFVIGGDVFGPMGPDFVPVDPARASKFIQDHGADRALRLDEISSEILSGTGTK